LCILIETESRNLKFNSNNSVQIFRLAKNSKLSVALLNSKCIYEEFASKFMQVYICEPFSDIQMQIIDDNTGSSLDKMVCFVNSKAETTDWRKEFQCDLLNFFDSKFMSSFVEIPEELVNDKDAICVLKGALVDLNRVNLGEFYFQLELIGNKHVEAIRCVGLRGSFYSKLADLNSLFKQYIQLIHIRRKVIRFKIGKKSAEKVTIRYTYRIETDMVLHKALVNIQIVYDDFKRDLAKRFDSDLTYNKVLIILIMSESEIK
jgi:hypothetical protein